MEKSDYEKALVYYLSRLITLKSHIINGNNFEVGFTLSEICNSITIDILELQNENDELKGQNGLAETN